jgi:DNA-binding MarR family transcriptional regulator
LIRQKSVSHEKAAAAKAYRARAAVELIEFFYSVHYEIGTALEDVVRADVLSRQQAAILWLIRAQGGPTTHMRRKDIETNLRRWFEVTSAAVSKSLRTLMRPPLALIEITESPRSGREKMVTLTPKGRAFLDTAAAQATALLAELIEDVPPDVIDHAITYFGHLTGAFENFRRRGRIRLVSSVHEAKDQRSKKTVTRG